ncbi:TetR family transcriptional regulator [Pseudomonas aeruginosa]|uniref:TetR family transcriptional regulator n=1 Tax=Pseudomonas aeruginosa TaxID=287 RepID=UPI00053E4DE2|nr:TetR family transcriptional regulator [Pseudomonas aeruginosa]ALZ10858.1 TetR family transcriptional regulator [Pseudomonas aeruginosa]KSL00323.1 TetR family transcriptional regulator [Pseudomonas aeruginosa]MBF1859744.1 TetR family transcriptional regulator [Pseudomonas aeruginosa]MBI8646317.1 TetR family transcriptional regulator [Pseudomonas aeruginosa]MBV6000760.1 TetR family transcriptional regulator [Pseudomonas aeruginosa]
MTAKIAGLREQQKAATRAELYQFGFELFLKQGFAETTIEQIVEPLGIAKRTFFRYFATKEDLVFAWYEGKTAELVAELKGRPKKEKPLSAVCETLASLLKRYDAAPDMAFALVRLLKTNPSLEGKSFEKQTGREKALANALIEREGADKLPMLKARIVVGVVMAAFSAALDEWYASEGKADLRPIVETAFSMARAP